MRRGDASRETGAGCRCRQRPRSGEQHRDVLLNAGLRAAWSTPLKAASGGLLGSLGVYRNASGLPGKRESDLMAHAAQLAGIAIQRRLAEEALRGQ